MIPSRPRFSWAYWKGWPVVLFILGVGILLYSMIGGQFLPRPIDLHPTDTLIPEPIRRFTPSATLLPSPTSGLVPTVPGTRPTLESVLTTDVLPTGTAQENDYSPIPPDPRLGFCLSMFDSVSLWAGRLGASWYLDWQVKPAFAEPPEHWKTVRVLANSYKPSLGEIQKIAQDQPGHVWILGNEPDVIWQDNVTPERYAEAYHQLYDTIKVADPTAMIAVGAVAQGTPLRLQYLDRVLQTYQSRYGQPLPADWWTVHGYVLREQRGSWGVEIPPGVDAEEGVVYEISDHGRLDLFESQLRDFRSWMARNGYQDVPLALTEFGILMPSEYGFPPEFVADYLRNTFRLLDTMRDTSSGYPSDEHHLIQRWAWFSLEDPTFPTANLAEMENDRLTLVGEAFRDFADSTRQP